MIAEEPFDSDYVTDFFSSSTTQGTHDQSVSNHGRSDILRVDLDDGNHYGLSARYEPTEFGHTASKPTELWAEYEVYIPSGYDVLSGGQKMPGIADTTGDAGWGSRIPGEDGEGWSARGRLYDDNGSVGFGYYVYSYDMSGSFGDNYDGATIAFDEWHTIREHVSMNDIGSQNGEMDMRIDGNHVINATDKEFRQDTSIAINSVWFDIYHGGSNPSPQDQSVFFDNAVVHVTDPEWDAEPTTGSTIGGDDVTGGTIDGDAFTEITMDGDVVWTT